ncbi:MAG: PA14 domain-containing protein [Pyrinomonadaceae bacterium]
MRLSALGRIADNLRPGLEGARYFNKPGIRVSLADARSKLPNCYDGGQPDLGKAVDTTDPRPCGIRLDGAGDGLGGDSGSRTDPDDGSRGYEPLAMRGVPYQAKRVNGYRLYSGPSYTAGVSGTPVGLPNYNRQTWIKVEIVPEGGGTLQDVTQEILSLGLTHFEPTTSGGFGIGDERAIIKMQRYEIKGNELTSPTLATKIPTARLRRVDKTTFLHHASGWIVPTEGSADDPLVPLDKLGPLLEAKYYAIRWEGQVLATANADYRFKVEAQDGVRLWVDGRQLIGNSAWIDGTAVTTKVGVPGCSVAVWSMVRHPYGGLQCLICNE